MNILFLTHQIPNLYSGATIRPFYLIKNLSEKYNHNIYVISFITESEKGYVDKIKSYCQEIMLFALKQESNNRAILINTLRNVLSLVNIISKITSKNGVFDPSYYSRGDIQKKIDKFIEQHELDAIYSDAGMAGYVANSPLPKIVEPLDINYKNWFHYFTKKNGLIMKIYWFIRFLQTFYRETRIYKFFDYCVVVTENDKNTINTYLSNVVVIPGGTDIEYWKLVDGAKEAYPSLITTGAMDGEKNIEAILSFYSNVYPRIKRRFPNIKIYIVGKNPHPKIRELNKDPSVEVTGFVEDMRPYLAKASVFICYHISGSGVKNQVLEAMAIGKPVISTTVGALGIKILPGKNIILENDAENFALCVIKLLNNKKLRWRMGKLARLSVEKEHSCIVVSDQLNELLNKIIENNTRRD